MDITGQYKSEAKYTQFNRSTYLFTLIYDILTSVMPHSGTYYTRNRGGYTVADIQRGIHRDGFTEVDIQRWIYRGGYRDEYTEADTQKRMHKRNTPSQVHQGRYEESETEVETQRWIHGGGYTELELFT